MRLNGSRAAAIARTYRVLSTIAGFCRRDIGGPLLVIWIREADGTPAVGLSELISKCRAQSLDCALRDKLNGPAL
jgi:hypothetical protein